MKKIFFIVGTALMASSLNAQQTDNVFTNGSTKDVYYNLWAGQTKVSAAADWDLAFATGAVEVSVLVNDVKGIEVYMASENIADWATLDTTGIFKNRLYNSEKSWSAGAFSNLGTSHPDYGWGVYNQTTHNVTAKRIFVLKFADGSYKKMIIDRAATDGNFDFRIANLNGTSLATKTFMKGTYNTRNFVHYNISGDNFYEHEPAATEWHLLFSKYYSEVPQGPGKAWYPVSGVKTNVGIVVAQRDGVPVTNNDTLGLGYVSAINEIGSDWKTFNNSTLAYDIVTNRTYFVKLKNGDIWKIFFNGYEGGSGGVYSFDKKLIAHNAGIYSANQNKITIYPNPANTNVSILTDVVSNDWTITLRNINGVVVKEVRGTANGFVEVSLGVNDLGKGIYSVELTEGNKRTTKRIAIQ